MSEEKAKYEFDTGAIPFRVAIDFDRTIAQDEFPNIGDPVDGAMDWISKFSEHGFEVALWTIRSGERLTEALNWLDVRAIFVDFVNGYYYDFDDGTMERKMDGDWNGSPKMYAHIYIDDKAFGCPLVTPGNGGPKVVDWEKVGPEIVKMGLEFQEEQKQGK